MTQIFQLRTPRLRLRQWQEKDRPRFASLNGDAEVMRYFPEPLTEDASDEMATEIARRIGNQGWGFWAVELIDSGQFIGFVGLNKTTDTPRGEITEVGWRLARQYWGNGYATEGAKAALAFAFQKLKLAEVYAFTAVPNKPSRAVMERLGMNDTGENFLHPKVPEHSPLREHVLYRISAEDFESDFVVKIEIQDPGSGSA